MDVSMSGELVAFGDLTGGLYLWSDKHAMEAKAAVDQPVTVNPVGISADTAIPSRRPPPIPSLPERWSEERPLSEIPMPAMDGTTHGALMSHWPDMPVLPTKPAQLIDDAFMASVTGKDFVGYASNPGFKRGQTHKGLPWLRRFLNGSPSDDVGGGAGAGGGKQSENKAVRSTSMAFPFPSHYALQEIKLGKLGIEDFAFSKYNSTPFGGLENTIPNSYTNAWIHTMFFNWPLRTRVLNYLSAKEVSLTDELGFLFHMLLNSRGHCCQATNFLRAFSQLPEASRLELLDCNTASTFIPREGSDKELLKRMQNLNRFVLEQMHKEMAAKDTSHHTGSVTSAVSAIDLVFGALMRRRETVLSGGDDAAAGGSTQESREFQWRLSFPKHLSPHSSDSAPGLSLSRARSLSVPPSFLLSLAHALSLSRARSRPPSLSLALSRTLSRAHTRSLLWNSHGSLLALF